MMDVQIVRDDGRWRVEAVVEEQELANAFARREWLNVVVTVDEAGHVRRGQLRPRMSEVEYQRALDKTVSSPLAGDAFWS